MRKTDATQLKMREIDRFDTPTDLSDEAVAEISRGEICSNPSSSKGNTESVLEEQRWTLD